MRQLCKKKFVFGGFIIGALIIFLHPALNARRTYEFIKKEDVLDYLHEETSENFTCTTIVECDYRDIISDDTTFSITLVDGDLVEGHKIKDGGEYAPQECKPRFSTAIIVPYRDRAEQLRGFLVYMHTFFRRQKIHYRIFVVEQVDSRPFNRAKLMNVGAVAAMRAGYPCLVLHDVDLLPLRPANIYACTEQPRHMSSSVNKFRCLITKKYNHVADHHSAIAITAKQFKFINGMSNEFFGLEGEDDDFYSRLEAAEIKLCRFDPETSRYYMVSQENKGYREKRKKLSGDTKSRISEDGLSSLKYTEVATVLHPLFTHIMVDL